MQEIHYEIQSVPTIEREFFGGTEIEQRSKMLEALQEVETRNNVTASRVIRKKIGRNSSCPCGSGIKFKKCCIFKVRT